LLRWPLSQNSFELHPGEKECKEKWDHSGKVTASPSRFPWLCLSAVCLVSGKRKLHLDITCRVEKKKKIPFSSLMKHCWCSFVAVLSKAIMVIKCSNASMLGDWWRRRCKCCLPSSWSLQRPALGEQNTEENRAASRWSMDLDYPECFERLHWFALRVISEHSPAHSKRWHKDRNKSKTQNVHCSPEVKAGNISQPLQRFEHYSSFSSLWTLSMYVYVCVGLCVCACMCVCVCVDKCVSLWETENPYLSSQDRRSNRVCEI